MAMDLITLGDVAEGMRIVSNDLTGSEAFTLVAFCYNEMYFLPPFLDHYRALGVGRFIIIDDRSTDGTRAFLAAQPDVMTLEAAHRYGAPAAPPGDGPFGSDFRVGSLWRTYLCETFCTGRWAILADVDEFAMLPPGLDFPTLAAGLDPAEGDVVYGPMIDTYPAGIAELERLGRQSRFDPVKELFFDAVPILKQGPGQRHRPMQRYGGARSRMMMQYSAWQEELSPRANLRNWLAWRIAGRVPRAGNLSKGILLHWAPGDVFYSAHRTSKTGRSDTMIPILHHKLNGALFETIRWALESGAYNQSSRGYRRFERMLAKAAARRGSFLGPRSARADGYESLRRSGNAHGLERFVAAGA